MLSSLATLQGDLAVSYSLRRGGGSSQIRSGVRALRPRHILPELHRLPPLTRCSRRRIMPTQRHHASSRRRCLRSVLCMYGGIAAAYSTDTVSKGGHEPAQAGLGASCISARANLARLGLARWSFGPRKWAGPELAKNSVYLEPNF
jgi:hypothetical protein